jgi:hypothetical protein
MKFVFRWLVIGAAVLIASLTQLLDAAAMTAGLLIPAAAIIIEAGYLAFRTARDRRGEG